MSDKKELYLKLITGLLAIICIAVVCSVVMIVPRAGRLMDEAEVVLHKVDAVTDQIEEIDLSLLEGAVENLNAATEQIQTIDLSTLNDTLEKLNGAATDLNSFTKSIQKLFGR